MMICFKCKQEFDCGISQGKKYCRCMEYSFIPFEKDAEYCMCEDCLKKIAQAKKLSKMNRILNYGKSE